MFAAKIEISIMSQFLTAYYEGGLNEDNRAADTRTYAQKCSLLDLLRQLKTDYPEARILGHYQLSVSVHKACPCFDAREEYGALV